VEDARGRFAECPDGGHVLGIVERQSDRVRGDALGCRVLPRLRLDVENDQFLVERPSDDP
jgi:hypothetical protein